MGADTIRLVIQQPKMPAYRVPVFRALAARPGIDLRVIYSDQPGPPNAEPDGYDAAMIDSRRVRIAGRTLSWHGPQWTNATRRCADALILSWNLNTMSLVPALLRAKANGVPTVLWGHGYSKQEAAWRRWPRDRVTALASALLFYNHTAADAFVQRGGDRRRVFVALNSLDQGPIDAARDHWLQHPDELTAFQREHQLAGRPTFIFVSRMEPANRLDLLVDAIAKLVPKHAGAQAIIIGKGDDERVALEARAEAAGVADAVRFLGPIYEQRALAAWMMSSTAFCYPANIGLSLLHAFGYGLPAVTSDQIAAQNPEIEAIDDGVNGLLYAHGDADALAAALERLVVDPELRNAMAAEARRTVQERFTLSNMVDGMEAAVRFSCNRS